VTERLGRPELGEGAHRGETIRILRAPREEFVRAWPCRGRMKEDREHPDPAREASHPDGDRRVAFSRSAPPVSRGRGDAAVRPAALALAVSMLALSAVSCGGGTSPPSTATVAGPAPARLGPVRRDPAPLTKRFGALGSPSAVRWQSGALGTSRAPGPTSFAIHAIVVLAASDARALEQLTGPVGVPAPASELPRALRGTLPSGTWRRERLDARLSSREWQVSAWLEVASGTIALTAIGGA